MSRVYMTDFAVRWGHVSDDGDRNNAVWIPKSLCEFEETSPDIIEVTMSERLATEKGLV